jgi:hypothetical protein
MKKSLNFLKKIRKSKRKKNLVLLKTLLYEKTIFLNIVEA